MRCAWSEGAERARLTVRDEGIGIAPEELARIFERFERAVSERHYGGLGLGLYITRQIVEALGGTHPRAERARAGLHLHRGAALSAAARGGRWRLAARRRALGALGGGTHDAERQRRHGGGPGAGGGGGDGGRAARAGVEGAGGRGGPVVAAGLLRGPRAEGLRHRGAPRGPGVRGLGQRRGGALVHGAGGAAAGGAGAGGLPHAGVRRTGDDDGAGVAAGRGRRDGGEGGGGRVRPRGRAHGAPAARGVAGADRRPKAHVERRQP